jgi:hypothetical protein
MAGTAIQDLSELLRPPGARGACCCYPVDERAGSSGSGAG